MPNNPTSTERTDPKTRPAPDATLENAGEGPGTPDVDPPATTSCPDPKNCTQPGTPVGVGLDQSAA
jgi:hypothetical protein